MRNVACSSSLQGWCRVRRFMRVGWVQKLCTCSIRLPACIDSPSGTARRRLRHGKQPPDAGEAPLRLRQAYRAARAARAAAMQLPAAAPTMALLGAGGPAPAAQAAGVRRACRCARVQPVCGEAKKPIRGARPLPPQVHASSSAHHQVSSSGWWETLSFVQGQCCAVLSGLGSGLAGAPAHAGRLAPTPSNAYRLGWL